MISVIKIGRCDIKLHELIVGIKGAGEMASAVAWRLYQARIRHIFMLEVAKPMAVRRKVSFCEAVHDDRHVVEDVEAVLAADVHQVASIWQGGQIAVLADPQWHAIEQFKPHVLIDAILAKKNLGTRLSDAALVIGLGPGFTAGTDAHLVIETNRGHDLGRIITDGFAEPDTGIPGSIGGYAKERVLRAPTKGIFTAQRSIGDLVEAGEAVGEVDGQSVTCQIGGILRGLVRSDHAVSKGYKLGDIDPRGNVSYCHTISDKARAISGSVLETIMRRYNI